MFTQISYILSKYEEKKEGYNVIKMDTFVINKACPKRAKKKTLMNNCCIAM